MICRIEDLKNVVSILLTAVDTSELSRITENLELKVEDEILNLSVTNGEYFVKTRIPIYENINFHATVNAELFLKLLSKTTTETVEFNISENSLIVAGNGEYNIPIIYDGDKPLTIPEIEVENITTNFSVESNILKSILQYNSKELTRGVVSNPVQKLYYIDNDGAITFTSGACVNEFKLPCTVKMLLNPKVVNLFKLFKEDTVEVSLGHSVVNDIEQTRVKFNSEYLTISAILPSSDKLLSSVPVSAIRGRAYNDYPYSVVVNRLQLLQTIDRLLLFSSNALKPCSLFEFGATTVKVYDSSSNNFETIRYDAPSNITDGYSATMNLLDFKNILESYTDNSIKLNFGDSQAFVVAKPGVYTIIPEVMM